MRESKYERIFSAVSSMSPYELVFFPVDVENLVVTRKRIYNAVRTRNIQPPVGYRFHFCVGVYMGTRGVKISCIPDKTHDHE